MQWKSERQTIISNDAFNITKRCDSNKKNANLKPLYENILLIFENLPQIIISCINVLLNSIFLIQIFDSRNKRTFKETFKEKVFSCNFFNNLLKNQIYSELDEKWTIDSFYSVM